MRRTLLVIALLWAVTLNAEVSVFDAGNLDKENPYGLTENEKILLKNKQKVEKLNQNIGSVQSDISYAQESIEGLRTVVDGLNQSSVNLDTRISELENKININDVNVTNEITDLKKIVKKNQAIQEENYKKITKAISELSSLIDSINSSKTGNVAGQNEQAPSDNIEKKSNLDGKSLADILKDADNAYKKKDYVNAKAYFEHLADKNHKPAYSNFMLGEIEYAQKNYLQAIPYYQNSVELYDKADYMPKLLYHTAISFDKTGDKKSANKFYGALKQAYPDSKEAKASPNRK